MNNVPYFNISKSFFLGFVLNLILIQIPQQLLAQTAKKEHIKLLYPNGKVKEKGKMLAGKRLGTWLFYNPSGWLELRIKYRNGVAVWQVFYNEKQQKTKFIDKDGKEILYKGCNCKH
jgi:antitoxin component YwqK of YwqJK toxin-antitoxin module